jgi:hypothetical protein
MENKENNKMSKVTMTPRHSDINHFIVDTPMIGTSDYDSVFNSTVKLYHDFQHVNADISSIGINSASTPAFNFKTPLVKPLSNNGHFMNDLASVYLNRGGGSSNYTINSTLIENSSSSSFKLNDSTEVVISGGQLAMKQTETDCLYMKYLIAVVMSETLKQNFKAEQEIKMRETFALQTASQIIEKQNFELELESKKLDNLLEMISYIDAIVFNSSSSYFYILIHFNILFYSFHKKRQIGSIKMKII